ncbi:MAG: hypothetical protein QM808_12915 [Steroidobacteraceae bacterium]
MLLDISPLRNHRDFRLVFIGQLVSTVGSFFSMVALPVQIYQLTGSSATVGLLGIVRPVPLAITALWGGALHHLRRHYQRSGRQRLCARLPAFWRYRRSNIHPDALPSA